MARLYEEPLLFVVLGVITAVILGFAWLQTGRKQFVIGLVLVVAMIIGVVAVERVVVTDREAVDAVLRDIARDVERNDLQGVLRHIHSEAQEVRAQAEAEFPRYIFQSVSIKRNLQITFDAPKEPQEAVAKFNVTVSGSLRNATDIYRQVPRYVIANFRKEGDHWRLYSYEHHDPREGLLRKSPDK